MFVSVLVSAVSMKTFPHSVCKGSGYTFLFFGVFSPTKLILRAKAKGSVIGPAVSVWYVFLYLNILFLLRISGWRCLKTT